MNLRQMALALVNHAGKVLPPRRAAWAAAMKHEVHYIEGDFQAVTWAAGCVMASYVERSAVAQAIGSPFARVVIPLFIAGEALNMLFAPAMTAAYRLQSGLVEFLGAFTPGDDYRRLVPLMEATPWWVHGLYVTASVLLLASAWRVLRGRAAFTLFASGWALGTAGDLVAQSLPAYHAAFSFAQPMFLRDYVIPTALMMAPVILGGLLWMHGRMLKR